MQQDAADIAAKERVQAWAELEQVKANTQANRVPNSPRGGFRPVDSKASEGRIKELQQQLNDSQTQMNQLRSQNQVASFVML